MQLKRLLKYRQIWLGAALIWIIMYHMSINWGLFSIIQQFGYASVDICIFASGAGCFYSLMSESDVVHFMKRRIKRIAPTYVIFILAWLGWQYLTGDFGFQMAIGNVIAIQNFTGLGKDFNWYISAIFLCYILAPYFQGIVEKASTLRKILFLVFLLVFTIPFWGSNTYIITVTRLPIFYIGMIFADMCKKDKRLDKSMMIGMVGGLLLGVLFVVISIKFASQYRWSHGLFWYPFILIIPPLCFMISLISMLLEKTKITGLLLKMISFFGDYSFELYLVHVLVFAMLRVLIPEWNLSNISTLLWVGSIPVILLLSVALRKLTALVGRIGAKQCSG